jgi:hypothetical protein
MFETLALLSAFSCDEYNLVLPFLLRFIGHILVRLSPTSRRLAPGTNKTPLTGIGERLCITVNENPFCIESLAYLSIFCRKFRDGL